jgi:hypothetical protein
VAGLLVCAIDGTTLNAPDAVFSLVSPIRSCML